MSSADAQAALAYARRARAAADYLHGAVERAAADMERAMAALKRHARDNLEAQAMWRSGRMFDNAEWDALLAARRAARGGKDFEW